MKSQRGDSDLLFLFGLTIVAIAIVVIATKITTAVYNPIDDYECYHDGLSIKLDSDDEKPRWIWVKDFKCDRITKPYTIEKVEKE